MTPLEDMGEGVLCVCGAKVARKPGIANINQLPRSHMRALPFMIRIAPRGRDHSNDLMHRTTSSHGRSSLWAVRCTMANRWKSTGIPHLDFDSVDMSSLYHPPPIHDPRPFFPIPMCTATPWTAVGEFKFPRTVSTGIALLAAEDPTRTL